MPRFPYMNFPFPYYNSRRFSTSYMNSPSPAFSANFQNAEFSKFQNVNTKDFQKNLTTQFQNQKQSFDLGNTSSISTNDTVSNLSHFDTYHFEKTKNKSNNNSNDYLFDLFGLKIYTDDVLLVSLIYFLYSEGVKDEGLFIVLILLLLS